MVDDQTLPAKVRNAMRSAVAVVVLFLPFVANGDGFEDGRSTALQRRQMFLLQMLGKLLQALGPLFKSTWSLSASVPT